MGLAFDITHLVTFLIGSAAGATGGYFATKYTDKRRKNESHTAQKNQYKQIAALMPELIAEMKKDFADPKNSTIRELIVMPNKKCVFGHTQPRFIYYEDEHQNLIGKIKILENHGLVTDVTPNNTPIYRMTEELWSLVSGS